MRAKIPNAMKGHIRSRLSEGRQIREISDETGYTPDRLREFLDKEQLSPKKGYVGWREEELAIVVEGHKSGASARAIATQLGRSYPSVTSAIARLRREGKL